MDRLLFADRTSERIRRNLLTQVWNDGVIGSFLERSVFAPVSLLTFFITVSTSAEPVFDLVRR